MYAYAAGRAKLRSAEAQQVTRHAVEEMAEYCGAIDSECGRTVVIRLGNWDPMDPRNCRRCIAVMGRQQGVAA